MSATACMSSLARFLHDENTTLPFLVRIALAHVQFETIHPFLDGNKRIGLRAADVFLALNGCDLAMSEEEAVETTFRLARQEMEREELIQRIERSIIPLVEPEESKDA